MSSWQSMKAAPKDGTLVLAHFDHHPADSPLHHFKPHERMAVVWFCESGGWVMPGLSGLLPARWMPLPPYSAVETGVTRLDRFECAFCQRKYATAEVRNDHQEHCDPRNALNRGVDR